MGKKFGKLMKQVAARMDALTQDEIAALETSGVFNFELDGQPITVEVADVDIISEDIPGWLVSNEGNLTVALEVELTDELRREGMARELINRIQNLRKETGLEITDRISVTIEPRKEAQDAVESFGELIKTQVLADEITLAENAGAEVEFDEFKLHIEIKKI
jgi:isoleucine--tRNA ligase